MTIKEILNGGVDDGTEGFEELPEEVLADALEAAEIADEAEALEPVPFKMPDGDRHLAAGASTTTLCGITKNTLGRSFWTHPSKAKRTDCLKCREAYRSGKMPRPQEEPFVKGDHIEFPDGSGWLVKSSRPGGVDVVCELDGTQYKKNATSTISAGSGVRKFTPEEWATAVEQAKPKPTPKPEAEGEQKVKAPSAGKWSPSKKEVDEVRRLRALGHSYIKIETELGWPDGHGNRPFRIIKGAWDYDMLRAE